MKKTLFISKENINRLLNRELSTVLYTVEKTFRDISENVIINGGKKSIILDNNTQNRVNILWGGNGQPVVGVKIISVFPTNADIKVENVQGLIVLVDANDGRVITVMEASSLTAIRTAAVGAMAVRYLSICNPNKIAFIGAGCQARSHFRMIKHVKPGIINCSVSSRSGKTAEVFINEMINDFPNVRFENYNNNYEKAVEDADIVVTAISGQEPILHFSWLKKGCLYVHVGGLEDDFDVALNSSKIVCDDWESVKHRTQTISRMYRKGLLTDDDIYGNIGDIIRGIIPGRENEKEIIYFDSVGLGSIDTALAYQVYCNALRDDVGDWFEF